MQIKDEEINLRITPKTIIEVEKMYEDFDILGLFRNAGTKEPRLTDYYMVIYAGYVGAKYVDEGKKIETTFEEFLNLIEDISFEDISRIGVNLLLTRKN